MRVVILARKPFVGSVTQNVIQHGSGGLDIHGCRVPPGRWPTNLILDTTTAQALDAQVPVAGSALKHDHPGQAGGIGDGRALHGGTGHDHTVTTYGDTGGASRFFKIV